MRKKPPSLVSFVINTVRLPNDGVVFIEVFSFARLAIRFGTLINELERREVEAGRRKRPFTDVEIQRILAERLRCKS